MPHIPKCFASKPTLCESYPHPQALLLEKLKKNRYTGEKPITAHMTSFSTNHIPDSGTSSRETEEESIYWRESWLWNQTGTPMDQSHDIWHHSQPITYDMTSPMTYHIMTSLWSSGPITHIIWHHQWPIISHMTSLLTNHTFLQVTRDNFFLWPLISSQ